MKFHHPLKVKREIFFKNSVKINNIKFQGTQGTVTGAVLLKTVLLTLLHNMFRLQPINCYDMKNILAEINFHKLRDE